MLIGRSMFVGEPNQEPKLRGSLAPHLSSPMLHVGRMFQAGPRVRAGRSRLQSSVSSSDITEGTEAGGVLCRPSRMLPLAALLDKRALPQLVVRLLKLLLGIHHNGSIPGDRLLDRLS